MQSRIFFITQKKHFWLLMLKTILLLHILCGNGDFLINIKFNEQDLFAFIEYINYIC